MPSVGRYDNPSLVVHWMPDLLPPGVRVEPIVLPTPDGAAANGTLYLPDGDPRSLVALMHPRVDFTYHYLVPSLLRAGYAVWAQRSRNVNNDVSLVHERLLIDIAVAHAHLAERGFEDFFLLGNSGGASLYCFYIQQASLDAGERLTDDPSGGKLDLDLEMPLPRGLILLSPHPGQGDVLMNCIDPSVTDESDGASLDPEISMYELRNGFERPPESSSYSDEFLRVYRQAQRDRVAQIDDRARYAIAQAKELRRRGREEKDDEARLRALVPEFIVVYRTDADPRTTDLSLDSSQRDYGSIFGVRPDVINHGPVGFGRLTTPAAWLSTWSGLNTRAAIRHTGPGIQIPTLLIRYSADNVVFPSDAEAIFYALASSDKTYIEVNGDHYGYGMSRDERSGAQHAISEITAWLDRNVGHA